MSVVKLRDVQIAYDDVGAGEAVVLLHSYPLNRTMWRAQIEVLRNRYRIITPDLRGHGETIMRAQDVATIEEMAKDVAALMDHLQIERATIGGLSMGGYVTLAFYHLFRDRVRALVLADTRAESDEEEGRRKRETNAQRALKEGMEPLADESEKKTLAPQTRSNNPELVARVRQMMLKTKPEGAAAALRAMAERCDHRDLLSKINVPTLIIVGSLDEITPISNAEQTHKAIKNSRLVVIAGAAHFSNLERPEAFNRALEEFLTSLQN